LNHVNALIYVYQRISMDNQLKKKNRMTKKEEKEDYPVDKSTRKDKKAPSNTFIRKSSKKRGVPSHDDDDDDVDSRGNLRDLIAYSSEEEESEVEEPIRKKGFRPRPKQRKAAIKAREKISRKLEHEELRKKKNVIESDSEDEEEDYDSEDDEQTPTTTTRITDEEDSEEEEDDYDEDSEEEEGKNTGILLNFGFDSGEPVEDWTVPKRYKIKKESEVVQKFYKLMTTPIETDTIDDHIDQFKALKTDEQSRMITALESRPKAKDQPVMFKILNMKTTPETQAQLMAKYNNLQSLDPGSGEYYKMRNWLEKATSLPLGIHKDMPIKIEDGPEICQGFMSRAKKCLDEAIYGQDEAKLQILQFIASKITNPQSRGMSLLLVGPPGIGKTSLIKQGIAKALDWPFQFISLGGDSDASTFSGHQMVYEGSHCGKIVNSLISAKSMSLVLMFDELDKISATPKGEEIQNLLVHLTDSAQNSEFEDKYLSGIQLDLSNALFVFSANDINKIDKVLLDRFTVVHLDGYGLKEKMEIAEKFLLPGALREVNLAERIGIPKEVVTHIMETYAKEEPGVRELKRCMEQIAQKINMLRLFNSPELPFYIKDFSLPFILKKEHIDKFLKERKPSRDVSHLAMYT